MVFESSLHILYELFYYYVIRSIGKYIYLHNVIYNFLLLI